MLDIQDIQDNLGSGVQNVPHFTAVDTSLVKYKVSKPREVGHHDHNHGTL